MQQTVVVRGAQAVATLQNSRAAGAVIIPGGAQPPIGQLAKWLNDGVSVVTSVIGGFARVTTNQNGQFVALAITVRVTNPATNTAVQVDLPAATAYALANKLPVTVGETSGKDGRKYVDIRPSAAVAPELVETFWTQACTTAQPVQPAAV